MTISLDHVPTPNNSTNRLRSYRRDAASFLAQNEQLLMRQQSQQDGAPGHHLPLDSPLDEKLVLAHHQQHHPCGSPPRFRPTSSDGCTAGSSSSSTSSTSTSSTATVRCRSRTPSPPHPRSHEAEVKAPRSISPDGTAASSPASALALLHSSSSSSSGKKHVHWSSELVTAVLIRPRTLREDVPSLFYSRMDERRFRREAEEACDETCLDGGRDDVSLSATVDQQDEVEHKGLWSTERERKDYGISKAVVVFGSTTKTYDSTNCCALEAAMSSAATSNPTTLALSFDDAAFWNGLITWS
ncbi:predicted protein [Thalassiosira pseudonana CCMP1335]|uniref:Uncharacterized protein n=1 Tax=Thalassiosira pseudonana TaxID=35128 RepID=B8C751_THAPS|nr:predicted protein [Thalassiosira pseudonana CCMP1335]EED90683.1 predicted protein [Thalassiosira pseudonana CCMP1335]